MRLILLTLVSVGLAAARTPYANLQAKREDIVKRLTTPRLRPRSSTVPCSTGVYDSMGACCASGVLDSSKACCSTGVTNSDDACCATGATDNSDACCPASEIYQFCDGPACCSGGTVFNDSPGQSPPNDCCTGGTVIQNSALQNSCCQQNAYGVGNDGYQVCCTSQQAIVGDGSSQNPYSCCPYTVYTDASGVKQCCSDTVAATPSDPTASVCCANSAVYYPTGSPNTPTCCPSGSVRYSNTNNAHPDICCAAAGQTCTPIGTHAKRTHDAPLETVQDKRFLHEDADPISGSRMAKRPGSQRTLLSANLVAEHLSNAGVFYHNGKRYIDKAHARQHEGVFQKALTFGINRVAKYAVGKYHTPHFPSGEYYGISPDYEIAFDDVPEIAARLLANSSFEHLFFNGRRFDRSILHDIVSHHPDFDVGLIEKYRN